jgi:geranylgeranyl diphosphate synthase type II
VTLGISLSPQSQVDLLEKNQFFHAFRTQLPLPVPLEPNFEAALRHVLDNPGSLIRPRIAFKMASAYGIGRDAAQNLAIALEYFHTASLLFDDLPCMDNALERRGVTCTHLAHGEDGAILTALAFINRAYALLWRSVNDCDPQQRASALEYVEQRLGVGGLLNGESLDLHFSSLPDTLESAERVAIAKTVSLIRLTLVLPAILGNAAPREILHIERLSLYWGLGYQIVDDLKDMLQSNIVTGKTTARDALLGHPNTAAVIGVPKAIDRLTRLLKFGDHSLDRLLRWRSNLAFLKRFRDELQFELARTTESPDMLASEVLA